MPDTAALTKKLPPEPAPRPAGPQGAARPAPAAAVREVRYEHSRHFAPLLTELGCSLLVSTYQAGKLAVVSAHAGQLDLALHNFERPMGVAVRPDRIAVGTRSQVWFLRSNPDLAPRLEPAGRHDACFLARSSQFTGDIQAHEMAWGAPSPQPLSPKMGARGEQGTPLAPASGERGWGERAGDELWVVNTAFSCLCTLHPDYSFVPQWRPPFVSTLAPEDRCHLNGLALEDGRPRYATALAETDTPQGWRPVKVGGGCLIDVPGNRVVARGFAMPHSPRVHQGRVWLLDSGRGALVTADPDTGLARPVAELPGYTRGLALHGPLAFVGLSKVRETSTFGGLPIAARRSQLKCGVAAVELATGKLLAHLEFQTGVEEIFDVQVLPAARRPALSGPFAAAEGGRSIWTVPDRRRPTA